LPDFSPLVVGLSPGASFDPKRTSTLGSLNEATIVNTSAHSAAG